MLKNRIYSGLVDTLLYGLISFLFISRMNIEMPMLVGYPDFFKYFFGIGFFCFVIEFLTYAFNLQTVGHHLFQLEVKFESQTIQNMFIRCMLKAVSLGSVFVALISFIMMLRNEEQLTMHDSIARSKVCQK